MLLKSASAVAMAVRPSWHINATVTESLVINPACPRMASLALITAEVMARTRICRRGMCWTDCFYVWKTLIISGCSFNSRAGCPPVINPFCNASSIISRCMTSSTMRTPVNASTCLDSHRWSNA